MEQANSESKYGTIGLSPMFPEWEFNATKTLKQLREEQARAKAAGRDSGQNTLDHPAGDVPHRDAITQTPH